jgi:hypothetical protein
MTEECISRLAPIMRQLRQTRERKAFLEQALASRFFPEDCRPECSERLLTEMESEIRLVRSVLTELGAKAATGTEIVPEIELPESGHERDLWTPFRYDRPPALSSVPPVPIMNDLAFKPLAWDQARRNPFFDWPINSLIELPGNPNAPLTQQAIDFAKEHAHELLHGTEDGGRSPGPTSGADAQGD